ncbi:MAG: SRPBCC family protein [Lentimicrobiaceae bacterium]|nr:SRPBCC family protein [Lentimicrobiaceae bacterium]
MRILLSILAVLAFLFLIYLAIGFFSKPGFSGQYSDTLKASPDEIFRILNDVESLPKRRKEVDRVEMLDPTEQGLRRWKEITDMGGYALFEVQEEKKDSLLVVRMLESSFGISGTWRYELKRSGNGTLVQISEESHCDRLLVRSILVLAGRNATLKQEVRNLKKVLKKKAKSAS